MALLEIKDLTLDFGTPARPVRAVDSVSLAIETGETLGLVGESGCGKTLTALSVARLAPCPPGRYSRGQVLLNGRDVLRMSPGELREIRGGVVSYVFQDPAASLNPVMSIGAQIKENLARHRPGKATREEVLRLLKLTGIAAAEHRAREFPFRLSGGMQQRVMLAMALACEPQLLVADEPTTALDVTIQAQILDLLGDLKRRLRMATLLISHNVGVVADVADRVAVMYAGEIVESGPARAVLSQPLHPYTRALLASIPRLGLEGGRLKAIPGTVPRPGNMPPGCRFAPRCTFRTPECELSRPQLRDLGVNRAVRCPYAERLPAFSASHLAIDPAARPIKAIGAE